MAQLQTAGLSATAIHKRVRAGRLHRIHRGVYAVGHAGLTDRGRWKAATLAIPGSVLSHRSAAELWQLLRPAGGVTQLTVPYPASPSRRQGIRIYRSRTLAARRTAMRDGIPLTMPERTLFDLARVATPAEVRRATREAEVRGLPLGGDHRPTKSDSDLEDDFFRLCRRYHVPLPERNVSVGRYRVDFLWRAERLVAESMVHLPPRPPGFSRRS